MYEVIYATPYVRNYTCAHCIVRVPNGTGTSDVTIERNKLQHTFSAFYNIELAMLMYKLRISIYGVFI